MVALTPQDVSRLAELARIELTQAELAEIVPQLDVILEAVASVGRVADQDIPPSSHAVPLTNVMREDELKDSWPAEAMLMGAPAQEQQRFRVPRIIDDSDAG
uniref:Asp-tRNA(Asn)/Glu-tRNA(Gln) amidotransferase subunit GatC n=1 Tax=Propionibacterium australiense TaxID=119981 RepID=UPI0018D5198E|nr:Asp-tRNA(Asn)/Glu-tRNA(Gln) amidotransferase subunit GatC [Propionibacterium australiense]